MDDLEEFMDDFESQSQQKKIAVPNQFDEVVGIVVSDSREKAGDVQRKLELQDKQSNM